MKLISLFCQLCEDTTPHECDAALQIRRCLDCEDRIARKMLLTTQVAEKTRRKKKHQRKAAAKRKRDRPKTAAKRELSQKAAAQREIYKRELARRHLLPFVQRYEPNYLAGWVHKRICEELMQFLEDVIAGKSPRLMITMPPRHGKSMLASQYFPAWALGNYPHLEFINTSYAQSLQMDFSRKIQELIKTPDFHLLFGNLGVTKKNEAVERWSLFDFDKEKRTGGGVLAAGVGGPITGRGAHVFLIDDPVKNREEAESAIIRETAKSWYSSTAYTRLAPGAGILLIQTRWHDDDLSGHLLTEMREAEKEMFESEDGEWPEDADRWRIVDFPAIATENEKYRAIGDALHSERYDIRALRKIKRTLAPRDWSALYQQNPQVEEGAYFKKKHVRYYTGAAPADMDIYCAGDLAISKREHADWTVFIVVGLAADGLIYVLEEYRGRWGSNDIINTMFEIHKKWKPRQFGLEKGQISLTLDDFFLYRQAEEENYDLHIEELPPGKQDKELRARTFQGLMEHNKVLWPEGALWVDDYINELLRFPSGVKDDRVDAAAWVGKLVVGKKYIGIGRKKPDKSWKKKLAGYIAGRKDTKNAMAA